MKSQRIQKLELNIGGKKEVFKADGVKGSPLINCRFHGINKIVFVSDLSQEAGQEIWLCKDCLNAFSKHAENLAENIKKESMN